ncbi:hypothetical protein C9374_012040 [Naegleria lovaniensis]|uniref:Uncharacterized protein n=1 Tax=Naegleria lovaniensis TaxID=51637 RepID=A0AA88G911_NAELO|nr:uncharacterized protein C9374_012040 [Naegleria lovaniensis]KAG2373577.1 hypothetical protein C9374_012040 [Naegleria lovaniensis]
MLLHFSGPCSIIQKLSMWKMRLMKESSLRKAMITLVAMIMLVLFPTGTLCYTQEPSLNSNNNLNRMIDRGHSLHKQWHHVLTRAARMIPGTPLPTQYSVWNEPIPIGTLMNCTSSQIHQARESLNEMMNYLQQPLNVTPDVVLAKVVEFSLTQATQVYGCSELINPMILQRTDSILPLIHTKACTYENHSDPLYLKDPCCSPQAALTACCAPRTVPFKTQRITQFNSTFIAQTCQSPKETEIFVYNYYRQYIEETLPLCQSGFDLFTSKINAFVDGITQCSVESSAAAAASGLYGLPTLDQVNEFAACWIDTLPKSAIRNALTLMGQSIHEYNRKSKDELITLFKYFMIDQYGQDSCEDSMGTVRYGYSQEDCEQPVCNVDSSLPLENCTGQVCGTECHTVSFGNATYCKQEQTQFNDPTSCEASKGCFYDALRLVDDTSFSNESACAASGKCSQSLCAHECSKSKCESMGICERFPVIAGKFSSHSDIYCVYTPMVSDGKTICKNNDTLTVIGCITEQVQSALACDSMKASPISYPSTSSECLKWTLCKEDTGAFSFKNSTSCAQCGGTVVSPFRWTSASWVPGQYRSMNQWIGRTAITGFAKQRRALDMVAVMSLSYRLVAMDVFPMLLSYVSCIAEPVLTALNQVVCDCVDRSSSCYSKPFRTSVGFVRANDASVTYSVDQLLSLTFKQINTSCLLNIEREGLMNRVPPSVRTVRNVLTVVDNSNVLVGDGFCVKGASIGDILTMCLKKRDDIAVNSTFYQTPAILAKNSNKNMTEWIYGHKVTYDSTMQQVCVEIQVKQDTSSTFFFPAFIHLDMVVSASPSLHHAMSTLCLVVVLCLFKLVVQ